MKNLVIKKMDGFLSIVDAIDTPLKLYEIIPETKKNYNIVASVFMKTFMISWRNSVVVEEIQNIKEKMEEHNFEEGHIEETKEAIYF